jgi:Protein of unknown function (DUF2695)
MPLDEEKLKHKAAKSALRQAEQDRNMASLSMPPAKMNALFDFIDQKLTDSQCDHSFRHTIASLDNQRVRQEAVFGVARKRRVIL